MYTGTNVSFDLRERVLAGEGGVQYNRGRRGGHRQFTILDLLRPMLTTLLLRGLDKLSTCLGCLSSNRICKFNVNDLDAGLSARFKRRRVTS